jgi:hypothetical protein
MIELMLFFWLIAMQKQKKNRKGWMKIFEASIAITLVMGFMVLVYSQTIEKAPPGENLMVWENGVLDNLKKRPELRQEILDHPETVCDPEQGGLVYSFIFERITKMFPGFGFSCRVCDPGEICGIQSYHKEVYSEERIIAATLTTFSPKKIKLFAWPLEPGEELKPIACTTNWGDCTEWSACTAGKKTRTCTDQNNCAKPATRTETQDCAMDTTAPGSVISLACGTPGQYLNLPISCMWTNPADADLNEINIYLDNNKIATLTKTQTSYSIASALTPVKTTPYILTIKTKDANNNEQAIGINKNCYVLSRGYLCQ